MSNAPKIEHWIFYFYPQSWTQRVVPRVFQIFQLFLSWTCLNWLYFEHRKTKKAKQYFNCQCCHRNPLVTSTKGATHLLWNSTRTANPIILLCRWEMALGSEWLCGRIKVKNVTLNFHLHSLLGFRFNSPAMSTSEWMHACIFFISAELWTKYLRSRSTQSFFRRNLFWVVCWPNSTLTKDLSVSAITIIAQLAFLLILELNIERIFELHPR